MAETIVGLKQLQLRLNAVSGPQANLQTMKMAAALMRGQMVRNMEAAGARKTGTTARSIQVQSVTETSATVVGNKVARWIDIGTGLYGPKHHVIVPTTKAALAFHSKAAGLDRWAGIGYRLSGRQTVGSERKFGAGADFVTVRSVKGMKARPYVGKSVKEVGDQLAGKLAVQVADSWNKAA